MSAQENIHSQKMKEAAPDIFGAGDWVEYLLVLAAYWWLVLSVTAIAMIFATIHFFNIPDLYTAETTILVQQKDTGPRAQREMLTNQEQSDIEYYGTQLAILTGRNIEEIVSRELGGEASGYRLDAHQIRDTHIIELFVTHQDPD